MNTDDKQGACAAENNLCSNILWGYAEHRWMSWLVLLICVPTIIVMLARYFVAVPSWLSIAALTLSMFIVWLIPLRFFIAAAREVKPLWVKILCSVTAFLWGVCPVAVVIYLKFYCGFFM